MLRDRHLDQTSPRYIHFQRICHIIGFVLCWFGICCHLMMDSQCLCDSFFHDLFPGTGSVARSRSATLVDVVTVEDTDKSTAAVSQRIRRITSCCIHLRWNKVDFSSKLRIRYVHKYLSLQLCQCHCGCIILSVFMIFFFGILAEPYNFFNLEITIVSRSLLSLYNKVM